ncbi:DUF2806 domain-containing protein [Pedobacter sp. KACC 23697]|uniref:DUF2806 domain-containing protein n=1 Tax=Pedobacter sp. KACC 23697 TaxID=3149230 RepID=A0AAU7K1S3_9SPHI
MQNPLIITGKPLEKLITLIGEGIGSLYEPTKIRRKADAEAYRIEKMAEAKAKGLIISSKAELTIAEKAHNRILIQEIDRQINIEDIAQKTVKYLKESDVLEDIDQDWKTRFFNKAKDISNDEMQEIWANILANEINKPGKTSVRTLEVLSNISQKEGKIFETFCSFSFDHVGIYHPPGGEIYKKFGLRYSDLQILRSARLVHSADNLVSPLALYEGVNGCFISRGDKMYVLIPGTNKDLTFDVTQLTEEGLELMNIIKTPKDDSYFNSFLADCKISRKIEFREATDEDLEYLRPNC